MARTKTHARYTKQNETKQGAAKNKGHTNRNRRASNKNGEEKLKHRQTPLHHQSNSLTGRSKTEARSPGLPSIDSIIRKLTKHTEQLHMRSLSPHNDVQTTKNSTQSERTTASPRKIGWSAEIWGKRAIGGRAFASPTSSQQQQEQQQEQHEQRQHHEKQRQ